MQVVVAKRCNTFRYYHYLTCGHPLFGLTLTNEVKTYKDGLEIPSALQFSLLFVCTFIIPLRATADTVPFQQFHPALFNQHTKTQKSRRSRDFSLLIEEKMALILEGQTLGQIGAARQVASAAGQLVRPSTQHFDVWRGGLSL